MLRKENKKTANWSACFRLLVLTWTSSGEREGEREQAGAEGGKGGWEGKKRKGGGTHSKNRSVQFNKQLSSARANEDPIDPVTHLVMRVIIRSGVEMVGKEGRECKKGRRGVRKRSSERSQRGKDGQRTCPSTSSSVGKKYHDTKSVSRELFLW